jgi:hypothetical protein
MKMMPNDAQSLALRFARLVLSTEEAKLRKWGWKIEVGESSAVAKSGWQRVCDGWKGSGLRRSETIMMLMR